MSLLQTFLGFLPLFSRKPSRQVMRRAARDYERSLDAAAGGRRHRGTGSTPSLQADVHGLAARVAARARYAEANNPLVASGIGTLVAAIVGCGLRIVPDTGDEAVNAILRARFEDATDTLDATGGQNFYAMQATLVRRMIVDGEGLCAMETTDDGLRLRLIDQLQLEARTDDTTVGGIGTDQRGKPERYYVYKNFLPGHPSLQGLEVEIIDAADMLHMFRRDAAGQLRGLSWLAPVLMRVKEHDEWVDAELMRQKTGAMYCGAVISADGTLLAGDAGGDPTMPSLEPGTLFRLQPGESLNLSDPPQIGTESAEFARVVVREIAAGLGLPGFLLDFDMERTNFSSARVALVRFKEKVEFYQDLLAFAVVSRVYKRWLATEVMSGRIPAQFGDNLYRHRVIPPRSEYLDPKNDSVSMQTLLDAGLTSRSQIIQSTLGITAEQLDRERAADAAREAALGIPQWAASIRQPVPQQESEPP